MRSVEDQIKEIGRRKDRYSLIKQLRKLYTCACTLTAMLVTAFVFAPNIGGYVGYGDTSYLGATILGPEAGGYVIVGLLSFILGILCVLIIQKHKRLKDS